MPGGGWRSPEALVRFRTRCGGQLSWSRALRRHFSSRRAAPRRGRRRACCRWSMRARAARRRRCGRGGCVTISPDGDGRADCAALRLRLDRASTVELVVRRGKPRPGVAHVARRAAAEGLVTLVWAPPAATEARTYVTHISSGPSRERVSLDGPVIRVQGSSARFGRESYAPGDVAILHVDTRAPRAARGRRRGDRRGGGRPSPRRERASRCPRRSLATRRLRRTPVLA